jgi:cytoskeletal protein CcmA (bactofilin family)
MKRRILLLILLFLALMLPTVVFAQTIVGSDEVIRNDVAVFGEDLTIEDGATVSGDIAVFNGNATIDGTVSGDVAVFNGDATINGPVSGDVAIFNGSLTLGETAVFSGDCVVFNGNITGDVPAGSDCVALGVPFIASMGGFMNQLGQRSPGSVAAPPPPPELPQQRSFWGEMVGTAFASLFMGLLAFGAAAVFPQSLERVSGSVRQKPLASGVVGFLTAFAVPILLMFLLIVTVILTFVLIGLLGYPILFGLSVVYGLAVLFGWLAMGTVLGGWLARILHLKNRGMKSTAVLGVVTLTLLLGLLDALSLEGIQAFITIVLLWMGLGAVALTKFGRRPYPPVLATSNSGDDDVDVQFPQKDEEKFTAVMNTLPDEANTLKN